MTPLLEVTGLNVRFPNGLWPVRDVSFAVAQGETLGIVGESGCGKSLTALSLMGLLPAAARRSAAGLTLDGRDLRGLGEYQMADIRGRRMSMIFQDPMSSLNPAYTIGNQLEETYRRHVRASRREARDRAAAMLEQVGISGVNDRLGQYPHQLSGGLRQRVMIAMALICKPDLLIADEPTTALDVTIQTEILHLLQDLQRQMRMALVLITHDLGLVARIAQRVMVMYAGQIVETSPTPVLFSNPRHPYTRALLDCVPVPGRTLPGALLGAIPGSVPALVGDLEGCHFRNRCSFVHEACAPAPIVLRVDGARAVRCTLSAIPATAGRLPQIQSAAASADIGKPLIEMLGVEREYRVGAGMFRRTRRLRAVAGVDLTLHKGEVLGLVGESGCGKSTLATMLLGILSPTGGRIVFDGQSLTEIPVRSLARRVQPVFQDPYSSLNPRRTVGSIVRLPLQIHRIGDPTRRRRAVIETLERVGLEERHFHMYPVQLSGGQRQRVAIARALVMRPEIVICDEPTSALDVSVQAQILNLLLELRREFHLTYLLISHNLAVVQHMATRVAVMYLGRVVECGPAAELFHSPRHPYTQALLSSVLTPDPDLSLPTLRLSGGFPNPLDPPAGCSFHPRCPRAWSLCRAVAPRPVMIGDRLVECHLFDDLSEKQRTVTLD